MRENTKALLLFLVMLPFCFLLLYSSCAENEINRKRTIVALENHFAREKQRPVTNVKRESDDLSKIRRSNSALAPKDNNERLQILKDHGFYYYDARTGFCFRAVLFYQAVSEAQVECTKRVQALLINKDAYPKNQKDPYDEECY